MDWINRLFSGSGFMPHGYCYTWDPLLIWLHVAADACIAVAYFAIPLTLVHFVRRRRDLVFRLLFLGFALFTVACGMTHALDVLNVWHPLYWLTAWMKVVTAVASVATATALVPQVPRALALASPETWRTANRALQDAQRALREANEALEERVAQRTAALAAANAALRAEIEERSRTEERLRESEGQLRTAVAKSPIPALICDETGSVRLLSQGWTDQSGYTLEDIPTLLDWMQKGYGESPGAAKARVAGRLALSAPVHGGERTVWAKDGRPRVWDLYITPLGRDRSGHRLLLGQAVDLTKRKEAEAAIRQANEELREQAAVLDLAPVLVRDLDGRIVRWSRGAERLYGYAKAEALGRFAHELLQTRFPGSKEQVEEALHRTGTWEGELVQRKRNGERLAVVSQQSVYRDAKGRPVRILEADADLTACQGAEAKRLHQREARFQLLIEHASDLITLLNFNGLIRFQSPSLARILGYQPTELLGQNAFDLVHPEDLTRVREAFARALAEPSSTVSVEYRFRHRDGAWRVLQSIGRKMWDDTVEGLVVVNSRDVTEQKRLETQLRQVQRMEAVGQLAGGVAHDFNNLLSVVIGHADLLDRGLPPDEPLHESVAEIGRAAERAAAVTRQLLAFGRQQVLEPQALDLNAVVRAAETMLRPLLGESIRLTKNLRPNLPLVRADPGQIDQVILNLAVNARDAMPRGGTLSFETGEVERHPPGCPEMAPARYVRLAVTDTGGGMTPEVQARIFEPFFTTKGVGKGTGLGLAVVHGIVEQSGGHVEVSSAPAEGTTFHICLPATTEPVACKPADAPLQVGTGRGETVLLVEDEAPVRAVTALLLKSLGYGVREAADAEGALRLVDGDGEKFDLLMTDVVMPGMTGRELADVLRRRDPGLKVLFQSGYAGEEVVRHGIVEAEVAFLQKPFTRDALASKLRDVLDG